MEGLSCSKHPSEVISKKTSCMLKNMRSTVSEGEFSVAKKKAKAKIKRIARLTELASFNGWVTYHTRSSIDLIPENQLPRIRELVEFNLPSSGQRSILANQHAGFV